jgi:hypothetical protein
MANDCYCDDEERIDDGRDIYESNLFDSINFVIDAISAKQLSPDDAYRLNLAVAEYQVSLFLEMKRDLEKLRSKLNEM